MERAIPRVKQKRLAFAAFLGVLAVPRNVVGRCCILTTALTYFSPRQSGFWAQARGRPGKSDESTAVLLGHSRARPSAIRDCGLSSDIPQQHKRPQRGALRP